jgi:hypothetical protein
VDGIHNNTTKKERFERRRQTADSRQQRTDRQQTADSRQQQRGKTYPSMPRPDHVRGCVVSRRHEHMEGVVVKNKLVQ